MRDAQFVAYPAFFKKVESGYIGWNEQLSVFTQGSSKEEVILMVKDAIELIAYDAFLEGVPLNLPKDCDSTKNNYDFSSYVVCDLNRYFVLESEKKVKKNCTIPESIAKSAEKKGINFSKILTYALEKELNLV